MNQLALIGAPSSAGAYAPGQEQAPRVLRSAGLVDLLIASGVGVAELGDVPGFRWRADRSHPRSMNASDAARVATATAELVARAFAMNCVPLVLGGDCTIELGTVAGVLQSTRNVGLIYIDLDTDLNTPQSTTDGALDWMGVAHMLNLPGTDRELASLGPSSPMLEPHQIMYFGVDNIEPFERECIDTLGIQKVGLADVSRDPALAATNITNGWARRFEKLLVHVDLDVLDYLDMPLAENTRRNWGLRFDQLIAALQVFVAAPNWSALTICELNPDHGEADGATVRTFVQTLAATLARSPQLVAKDEQRRRL